MNEQPRIDAVANRAQTARSLGVMLIIQLTRILDRQDVATFTERRDPRAASPHDLLGRHFRIAKPTAIAHALSAIARKLTDPHRAHRHHAGEKTRPPFSAARRQSSRHQILQRLPSSISIYDRQIETHAMPEDCNTPEHQRLNRSHPKLPPSA